MNILKICYPTFGGSGVVATELGIALAQKSHNIHFLANSQPVRFDLHDDDAQKVYYHQVPIVQYPLFQHMPYESAMVSKIVELVIDFNIQIIHVHYAIPYAAVAFMAKQILQQKNRQVKVLTTLHGTDITLVGKDKSFEPVVEFSINQSDCVTTVSKWLKEVTHKSFDVKKDIKVVHNFVECQDSKISNYSSNEIKKAINFQEGEKIISHASNFRQVKRIDDIIRAIKMVAERQKVKLILCGEGPEKSRLENLSKELGLSDTVFFLGNILNIRPIYHISDLYFLASETESFGLSALESMACRTPIICSNCGGITEFVIDGINGKVRPVGDVIGFSDVILELLSDEGKLQEFSQNARKTALGFSKEKITAEYENIYQNMLR